MDYSKNGSKRQKQKLSPHGTRLINKAGLLFFRVLAALVLIGGFAAGGIGMGLYAGIIANAPALNTEHLKPTNYTTFIYDTAGRETDRLSGEQNRVYANFDQIPQNLRNAFIAIEDERFYSHNGIDVRGIGRALYQLVRTAGGRTQGASTITQQLIKNKLDRFDSDLITKLQEQYLAVQFERELTANMNGCKQSAKDYILEIYLNEINLGRGNYGVQAASWHYYGKDVSELTLAESATIAAITQNPTRFPPDIRPESNWLRAQLVLEKMLELEFITQAEFDGAFCTSVYDNIIQGANLNTDGIGEVRSYFTDQLITEVSRDLREKYNLTSREASNWIYTRGLRIFSTQDTSMQHIVDRHMLDDDNFSSRDFEIDVEYRITTINGITNRTTNHERKRTVKTREAADDFVEQVRNEILTANDTIVSDTVFLTSQPQACFVVMDPFNGHVKAISGGRGEKPVNRSFNRATDAVRSPGSQFKVLASYAPALDLGRLTAASVIDDAPFVYDDGHSEPYTPRNWWGSAFEGLSTVRRGIYRSMNVLAVRAMLEYITIETAYGYLTNFGFTTLVDGEWRGNFYFTDKVASLPLGGLTDGVRQVELCAAYAAIANLGEYNKPIFYTKVLDHDGNVLLENRHEPRRVLRDTTAYILTDTMRDTITNAISSRKKGITVCETRFASAENANICVNSMKGIVKSACIGKR
jgi:penicillin-binding protein 1A